MGKLYVEKTITPSGSKELTRLRDRLSEDEMRRLVKAINFTPVISKESLQEAIARLGIDTRAFKCKVCGGRGHKDSSHELREAVARGESKVKNY